MCGAMKVCGIDPGLKGAIALVSEDGVHVSDMPILGKGIDDNALASILRTYNPDKVILEDVALRPRQTGVKVMCVNWGRVYQLVKDRGIPVEVVASSKWCIAGKSKEERVAKCRDLYPDCELPKSKDGRADALLLARWGLTGEKQ